MLETVTSILAKVYSIPCGDVGTSACEASWSVACSPIGCVVAVLAGASFSVGAAAGAARLLDGMAAKYRYWLVRHICRRYARDYLHVVDRMGLDWTLALIDEDVEMSGYPFNHALARAGVIDYAERTGKE